MAGFNKRLSISLKMFYALLFVITISMSVALPQFYPNFGSPNSLGVPSLFPVLNGNDNKNNGGGGWPFFGGLLAPQQQQQQQQPQQNSPVQGGSPYNQNPNRQDSPYGSPFFGGYPGFSSPWYNPQQQRQPAYQQQQPAPYQPQQNIPAEQQQYQNPSSYPQQQPSRQQQQQPSLVNPSSYPSPSQPPVATPPYQQQNPNQQQQQGYPINSQWNPQQPVQQTPPKLDDGQYRPGPDTAYQSVPPNHQYAQNQPTMNVNGEPYGQQQQQGQQPSGEFVGDVRNNPQKETGTSQQLLPAAGSAPGQGWVYPDDSN